MNQKREGSSKSATLIVSRKSKPSFTKRGLFNMIHKRLSVFKGCTACLTFFRHFFLHGFPQVPFGDLTSLCHTKEIMNHMLGGVTIFAKGVFYYNGFPYSLFLLSLSEIMRILGGL
jgi:hypothetical protein